MTNLATLSLVVPRTAASSLIRCGLLPVFSNCSITPVTISSLIPSVSIFASPTAPGEGGGVWSKVTLPLLLGRSTKETSLAGGADADGFDGDVGDGVAEVCVRLIFFAGGCCGVSVVFGSLEGGERCARELLGSWMPREGRERDFRRVLYGIVIWWVIIQYS